MDEKKKNGLFGFFKKIKTEYLIIAAVAIVIIIVLFGIGGGGNSASSEQTDSVEQYVESLEQKLKNCLTNVKGAGKVDVIISVNSSMQTVFATEKNYSKDSALKETPIIVSGKPVVLKQAYPEIVGVVIVAKGASNISVKVDLLNACQTFLSITEDKIQILTMK